MESIKRHAIIGLGSFALATAVYSLKHTDVDSSFAKQLGVSSWLGSGLNILWSIAFIALLTVGLKNLSTANKMWQANTPPKKAQTKTDFEN